MANSGSLFAKKNPLGAGLKAIGAVNAGPGTGEPFRPHLRGGIMAREPRAARRRASVRSSTGRSHLSQKPLGGRACSASVLLSGEAA
jgi:hypothetical protein